MTETTYASPRLERPGDSAFRGVCTALARTTGTDVLLWRVLAVVLTVFGGLGIALYLVGLAVIPRVGQEHSLAQRLLHGPDRHLVRDELLILVVTAVAVAAVVGDGRTVLAAVVLVALALLVYRRGQGGPVPPVATPTTRDGTEAVAPAAARPEPAASFTPPPLAPPLTPPLAPPLTPRPRSPLTGLTLSAALLVAGVLVLVGVSGAATVTAPVVVAAALVVVAAGLVVGAWWGRPRGLTPVAVLLALALGGTAAAQPALDHGVGTRTWVAAGSSSYRLGVGQAELTLSGALSQPGVPAEVRAKVDVGHLVVIVPAGLRAVVDAHVQLGDIQERSDGGGSPTDTNGRDVSRHLVLGPAGAPQVHVVADVYAGQLEVRSRG